MHIQKATTRDLSLVEHWIHVSKEVQTPSGHDIGRKYNEELIKNGIGLVAVVEEHLAGFILAEANKKTGFSYLTYLIVAPKYRGLGLGKRLLKAYLDECKKRHITLIVTYAPLANKKAVAFYKRQGFSLGRPTIPVYKKLRP